MLDIFFSPLEIISEGNFLMSMLFATLGNTWALLVPMSNGAVAMENNMLVP